MTAIAPDRHLAICFGATGDLAQRKVLPSFYRIGTTGVAAGRTFVLGAARSAITDEAFRETVRKSLVGSGIDDAKARDWCAKCVYFQSVGEGTEADYARLRRRIEELEKKHELQGNRIFYLALPLPAFPPTIQALGQAGLNTSGGWTRLVVEKPFGHDLGSAQALNALVHRFYDESSVFRLDHYLGKETVQNLIAFRFGNSLFEPLWNRDRVERVEITVAEDLGVEGRAAFYEGAGAVRDVLQNHVLQLLCLTAMEPPVAIDGDSVSNEKIKILRAAEPFTAINSVLGQYGAGEVDGKKLKGYREEPGIAPESQTETYVAVRTHINTWRWHGVPFYLRTGKRMARKMSRIAVTFRSPPAALFNPYIVCGMACNRLEITLQPNEGFNLAFQVKIPGDGMHLKTEEMRFRYGEAFGTLPDAYETLMLDVMRGDRTLFVRHDEMEAAWKLCEPLLEGPREIHEYPAGTWGPHKSDTLLAEQGFCWTHQ